MLVRFLVSKFGDDDLFLLADALHIDSQFNILFVQYLQDHTIQNYQTYSFGLFHECLGNLSISHVLTVYNTKQYTLVLADFMQKKFANFDHYQL